MKLKKVAEIFEDKKGDWFERNSAGKWCKVLSVSKEDVNELSKPAAELEKAYQDYWCAKGVVK